jgi:hypothetical protein
MEFPLCPQEARSFMLSLARDQVFFPEGDCFVSSQEARRRERFERGGIDAEGKGERWHSLKKAYILATNTERPREPSWS